MKPSTRLWPPSANPRVSSFGPSTYSPVGSLDPAPSLEAPGPGFPAYPTEDFPSQVRAGETAEVPHPLIEVPGTASEPERIGNP